MSTSTTFVPFDRIIVLALDSVCWDVLQPLIASKSMPALSSLLQKANYGVLESTVPPHTAAAWTTFLTGKDPGLHGVIDFVHFDPVRHCFRFHDSSVHRADSIFTRLTDAGISCGSIFLPRNYPPYPLPAPGYIVSGFETPGVESHFTEPESLRAEVLGVSPDLHFNFEEDWEAVTDDSAFARNMERAIDAVDVLERLSVHLQRERSTTLHVAYLQATDILFHKAWKWCIPPPASAPNEGTRRRELVKQFFTRIDTLINRALGLHSSRTSQRFRPGVAEPKVLRLICSDHGHGRSNGRVYINNLLQEWGYLCPLGSLSRVSRRITLSLLSRDAAARRVKSREMALDWSRTKAYLAHVGIYGFVYINLKGREPHGIVPPDQFESVRNALIERFLTEKIPGTQNPLFIKVYKGEELYARKQELNLPDLIVVPSDGYYPRKKLSRGSAVRVTPEAPSGVHRVGGIYAFEGVGIVSSQGLGQTANIADIAPTLLAALGQPIPRGMTGKPMLHIFENPPPINYVSDDGSPSTSPAPNVYSSEEQRAVEKRLEDLGYLE